MQKIEAVGTLAGGIAHDFNNLLTAISGFGTLLEMQMAADDPLRKNVTHILTAADRAANLTRSLLTFSRAQPLEVKIVDLNDIVRNLEKLLARLLREDIDCRLTLADCELCVKADPGQIEQVLMNLATNARDAMPNGGQLTISTMVMDMDRQFIRAHGFGSVGRYALLSVTDNGSGMTEEVRQRIFDPFFTTKEVNKGTGLGLSIIHGIIRQHGGFITCYSEPGIGTTFNIYLPLHKGRTEQEAAQETDRPAGGSETVLLAEDDEMVRNFVRTVLESAGYRVIEAVNGQNAVQKFADNRTDVNLLILDLIMPRLNGRDAYNEIRSIDPDVRVVFTSGYSADVTNIPELITNGYDFIAKPVRPAELLKKVRELLDRPVERTDA
jgi:CheY-like chemotaxis protein